MTDVEFAEIRYSGGPATFLRAFRAVYLALPINLIIMGWVTLAMVKILGIALGISPVWAVGICFVITVAYSAAAGMWAVLWTDLVQLVIKMTAVIVLAVYAVRAVGGMGALKEGLAAHFGSLDAALSVVPPRARPGCPRSRSSRSWPSSGGPRGTPAPSRGRRLRRAADLLGQEREGRDPRDALLQRRPLRAPALALDHHGPLHRPPLPRRRRDRREEGRGGGLRAGDGRPPPRAGRGSSSPASPRPTCRRSART